MCTRETLIYRDIEKKGSFRIVEWSLKKYVSASSRHWQVHKNMAINVHLNMSSISGSVLAQLEGHEWAKDKEDWISLRRNDIQYTSTSKPRPDKINSSFHLSSFLGMNLSSFMVILQCVFVFCFLLFAIFYILSFCFLSGFLFYVARDKS